MVNLLDGGKEDQVLFCKALLLTGYPSYSQGKLKSCDHHLMASGRLEADVMVSHICR